MNVIRSLYIRSLGNKLYFGIRIPTPIENVDEQATVPVSAKERYGTRTVLQ